MPASVASLLAAWTLKPATGPSYRPPKHTTAGIAAGVANMIGADVAGAGVVVVVVVVVAVVTAAVVAVVAGALVPDDIFL